MSTVIFATYRGFPLWIVLQSDELQGVKVHDRLAHRPEHQRRDAELAGHESPEQADGISFVEMAS